MNKTPIIKRVYTTIDFGNYHVDGNGSKTINQWGVDNADSYDPSLFSFKENIDNKPIIISYTGVEHRGSWDGDMSKFFNSVFISAIYSLRYLTRAMNSVGTGSFNTIIESAGQTIADQIIVEVNNWSPTIANLYPHLYDTDEDGNYIYNSLSWGFSILLNFSILYQSIFMSKENVIAGCVQTQSSNYSSGVSKNETYAYLS